MAYHLKILKLRSNFELIWIDATPGNDGYGQKLYNHITTRDEGFLDNGIFMVAKRRVSLETPLSWLISKTPTHAVALFAS
jgi:hypothetical protein